MAAPLVIVVVVLHLLATNAMRIGAVSEGERHHAADARSLEAAHRNTDAGERPMDEVAEVVETIASRPGVTDVTLVDARGVVVMAGAEELVGQREDSPAVRAALAGRSYAGGETEADENASNFEFIVPVVLPVGRFALEVDQEGAILERQLGALRDRSLLFSAAALLLGMGLLYFLGGAKLTRRHRDALERATLDALTGLGNHRTFEDDLRAAVALARRQDRPLAAVIIDIDDFKLINDRRGHRAGDAVLIELATLLRSSREEDRAFRIGGDEFAMLLPDCDGPAARAVLERLMARAPALGFTAGVATLDGRAAVSGALLWERADAALYAGKGRGRGGVTLFDEIADHKTLPTPEKLRALAELLDEPRIDVVFQPIWRFDGDRQALLGFEALARPWSGYGFDGPADAFAAAEKAGRAHELDTACREAALARAGEVPPGVLLFVNVHPHSLSTGVLQPEDLHAAVARQGLEPSRLVLEVTEHQDARLGAVTAAATRLRAAGFLLALDDVGTGNSGLETLRLMPVDFVKIDQAVVANALHDESAQGVLLAIVAYARRTNTFIIAEGVESHELLAMVRELHAEERVQTLEIDGAQGFVLGMPGPEPRIDGAMTAAAYSAAISHQ